MNHFTPDKHLKNDFSTTSPEKKDFEWELEKAMGHLDNADYIAIKDLFCATLENQKKEVLAALEGMKGSETFRSDMTPVERLIVNENITVNLALEKAITKITNL